MALLRLSNLDPIDALLSLQRELERTFDHPRDGVDLGLSGRGVFPPINVFSDLDHYLIRAEVPGVDPGSLEIDSRGRTVTIRGLREPNVPEGGSYHRRERPMGGFSRSIQLPPDLEPGRAEASCKNGMLTIRVPKREESKPRQIKVQAS
ncbi:MAG: hypothetical protein QOD06_506 [Candidatus Binatota bacterium]|jgi:HSP20 family protein|nr:hypothetical protein [Candidatus Binatota bacterium]